MEEDSKVISIYYEPKLRYLNVHTSSKASYTKTYNKKIWITSDIEVKELLNLLESIEE